jgi:predicted permease
MLFALALTCGVGILLGLAPAARLRSLQLHDVFKQSSHQSSGGRQGRGFRNALVIAEVAFAMLLLVGAGLLMRSLQHVMATRLGFDPSGLLTMRVSLPGAASESDAASARDLLVQVARLPGVESAALGSDAPLTSSSAISYAAEGHPEPRPEDRPRAYIHFVTTDFFHTLRIPLIAGRTFTEAELQDNANVTIVSENIAKRFWPNENPIGKRIKRVREAADFPWLTIVGVVNEMKYRRLPENPTDDPDLFVPFSEGAQTFSILVRSSREPSSLAGPVRGVLREADPAIVAYQVNTMHAMVASQTSQRRFTGWLMGVFAGSALLLAMIGIYGVVAYGASQRTQEIGVRMALGAERGDVLRLIAGSGLGPVACGLAIGAAAALTMTQWLGSLLYGIKPTDPLTFSAAALTLMTVATLAMLAPALRATRIAPVTALRDE